MGDNVFKQDFGGLGGFLGGLVQRGASPELGMIENEQYTDRIISAIEDGLTSPTPFTLEGALSPVNVANGIDAFEMNYVKGLLDQGLVTIADVAAQTGIPAADIARTAEALSTSTDLGTSLLGSTVGSNEMFVADEETTAAANEASQAAADALEGSLEADSDLMGDIDTIVDSVAQSGSTDVSGGVTDVQETWNYDKGTDSFISTTTGESVARTGDSDVALKDGGEYSVRPVLGTEGVTAEQVVDVETNEPAGNFVIDVLTGLPTLKKITGAANETDETVITDTTDTAVNGTVDVGPAAPTGVDDNGTATGGGVSVTGTLSDDTYAGVPRVGGGTLDLNVADTVTTGGTGVTSGAGTDDGAGNGDDNGNGLGALTGLLALGKISTPLADEIYNTEFKMDYLKPELLGLLDLSRGRRSTGRNT
jgi:hypothetical protein